MNWIVLQLKKIREKLIKLRGTAALSNIGKLYNIFTQKQKKTFGWLVFFTFLSSLSDLLGLSFVIPVVGLVLSETFYNSFVNTFPFLAGLTKSQLLLTTVSFFFFLILLKNAFGLYINKLQVEFVRNLYVSSSKNVLNKVYDRSLSEIQDVSSNTWVNKLTGLQIALCSNAAISTIIIINEVMIFTLTALVVCVWNWHLFILLIAVLAPMMGLFYSKVKDRIKNAGQERSNNMVKLYARAQEMIFGYTDIKIAGTEASFKKKFEDITKTYSRYQARMDFMMFIPTRIIEIAIFLCIIMILLYGVYVIKDTEKIVTTISLFSVIAYRSIPSVNRFVMSMNNLNSTEFIFTDPDFWQNKSQSQEEKNNREIAFNNSIKFDHFYYQYSKDSKFVIRDCNLEIKKGEKIGIVGKSGSGKSTLINNILGFTQPSKGKILIDGVPLTQKNVTDWWSIVGYVRQEVFIMNATMLENIAIGELPEDVDVAKVNHAIEMASLKDLVDEWPEGVYTMLNERGSNLSGGQKQRIAIARAIYKGAEVLIFDEATAALDSKTEEEITNSIRQLGQQNLTIIIIAHRYSSLKYCDKIHMLDNGHIHDSFSYQELITVKTE